MLLLVFFRAVLILIGAIFCKIGFYVLIIACIWTGVSTDTSVIFYAISNFKDLKIWLGQSLPYTLGQAGDFFSAFNRISKILEAEEISPIVQDDNITDQPLVQLKHATVKIQKQRILNDVSLKITSGLTLITGIVGSGKSSILKAILQDYPLSEGFVETRGRVSYASQEPWLFPSSIKQNILFGEKYNEKRYREVVKVCALVYDFNLLDKGDETIVSDRGLNLSKGQQARINLARAVYRDSQIYLLDDCLTALDTAVQEYIFKKCIKTFLNNKICILVSQTTSHIREADKVIIMEEGSIKTIGSLNERMLREVNEIVVEVDNLKQEDNEYDEDNFNEETGLIETEQVTAKKKIYHEIKKEGAVDYSVYGKYIMYGGGFFLLLITIAAGGVLQFALSYSDKLLTQWIDKKQIVLSLETNYTFVNSVSTLNNSALNEAKAAESNTFMLYSVMLFTSAALQLLATFMVVEFCRRASINIHKEMTNTIFNAVMSFFDTHFIGNILNRFSQDLVNIDELLPYAMNECFGAIFTIIGGLILIISVNVNFGIYILIMVVILIILRRLYLPAGRSLKRLEAATRSPMLGHLNATLEGLTTIRACKVEDILIEEYDRHQDLYTSAHYISTCSNRALGFFMDSVCTCLVVVVVVRFVFFDSDATAGDVGLALTQVVGLGRTLQWGIREWAELENLMTSTERLLEYTEIKVERKGGTVIDNWPIDGTIIYEKVFLSYYNSEDYVLQNLNFSVKSKEKIGIVGRTGAGKSSIISTIFRLYEVQGKILIDGVDIKTLPLETLRKNIAIIPQDPILFSGSIRTNLDPFNEFDEKSLWFTLETVGMKNAITSLNQTINSSSLKFSSGQKQLICLARAILRKNKIVVMDEATANIDPETDKILCNIIKKHFSNSTVFTIAHRLHSVLDCDRVMVLSRGEIEEFDKPNILLNNTNSLFYKMVKQADLLYYAQSTHL